MIPDRADAHVNYRYAPGPHARRGRGAAARAVRRAASWRSTPTRRPAPCRDAATRCVAARCVAAGDLDGRAQAGVDAGRRVRRGRHRRRQLRPRRAAAGAHGATSRSRSPRSCAATQCWRRSPGDALSPPSSTGTADVSVRAPRRGARRGSRRAASTSSTSASASRARRRRRSSARRWSRRVEPSRSRPTRPPTACPSCATAIAGWVAAPLRRGAGSRHARSSPRSAPRRRSSASRRSLGGPARGRRPARPATRSPSAARCSPARESSSCRCDAERGFLPDLDARRADVAPPGDPVDQLPEQPDRRATAPLELLRARRGAAARARLRARLRRGLLASSTSTASRPRRRCSSPTARTSLVFNTLSKRSSMPGYRAGLRRRRPGADRRAQALPAERRRRAAGRSSSAPPSPPGATRPTSRRSARATAPSATCCCPRWRRAGLRHAGGDATFFLWLDAAPTTRRSRRAAASTASSSRPASFLGAGGEGHVRIALVPTLEAVRARGGELARRWRAGRR